MPMKSISMRDYIGDILCEFGSDSRVFVIDSDLAKSTTAATFAKQYPAQFIEAGISEQSAMSIANGLALENKIPFYVNFAIFATGTAWTQLRQACYSNANVKVIGTHPGLDDAPDGASHHANEDIALARVIPNLCVLTPSNLSELRQCIQLAIQTPGPFYIRVARDYVPDVESATPVALGKAVVNADDGNDIAILYEGSAAMAAYEGYSLLTSRHIACKLINILSIKPLDVATIRDLSKTMKGIVTVENHSVLAGLGGAVAEMMAVHGSSAALRMVGIADIFTESGSMKDLKDKYGITGGQVVAKALEILQNSI